MNRPIEGRPFTATAFNISQFAFGFQAIHFCLHCSQRARRA
jgi:hypothetical protein